MNKEREKKNDRVRGEKIRKRKKKRIGEQTKKSRRDRKSLERKLNKVGKRRE